MKTKEPVDTETVERLITLALDFHKDTGADIGLIQIFMAQVGRVYSDLGTKIMQEEIRKAFQGD